MALGRWPVFAAQNGRREITIGGRAVPVVDVHAHCEIRAVESVVRGTPLELEVQERRMLGPARMALMDELGIDIQVVHVGQYWWYSADPVLARRITRVQDEGVAEWCDRHPDRFVGLSTVALQHPELAAEQLEYAVRELGLRGASIGGHVNGEVPSTSRFDPFWAKLEELDVPVFMHPQRAAFLLREGALDGRGDLNNIVGNPLETTVFLSRLIFDGTFDRFPGIKVCAAHGGGYLPSYSGRTEVTCQVRSDAECANEKRPREYLQTQILVDSMVFTHEGLRHLVEEMGATQVVYGTDIPYNWPDTLDLIVNAPYLTDAEKKAIVGGNLMQLLRIG